jgi:hypothetical protein
LKLTKLPKNYLKLIELSEFGTAFPEVGGVYGGKIKNELIIINNNELENHDKMTFYQANQMLTNYNKVNNFANNWSLPDIETLLHFHRNFSNWFIRDVYYSKTQQQSNNKFDYLNYNTFILTVDFDTGYTNGIIPVTYCYCCFIRKLKTS